jgi:hypothetical protein
LRSYFLSSALMMLKRPCTRHVSTVTTVSLSVLRRKNRIPSMPGITFTKCLTLNLTVCSKCTRVRVHWCTSSKQVH